MPNRALGLMSLCLAATLFFGFLASADSAPLRQLPGPGFGGTDRGLRPTVHQTADPLLSSATPLTPEPAWSLPSDPPRSPHPAGLRGQDLSPIDHDAVTATAAPLGMPQQPVRQGFTLPLLDRPANLSIPALQVSAPVVPVDLDPDGNLELTDDPTVVFWYRASGYPGQVGRLLLAGHLDSRDGRPGIFASLFRLGVGDEVLVFTEQGIQYRYRVIGQQRLEALQIAHALAVPPVTSELILITCAGWWDPQRQRYTHNLLVYATLKSVSPDRPGVAP